MFHVLRHKNFDRNLKQTFKNTLKKKTTIYTLITDFNYQDNSFKVSEMYQEKNSLFILLENGLIFIIDLLNPQNVSTIINFSTSNKVAKSISINKLNNSLLIIYLNRIGNYNELKCCSYNLNQDTSQEENTSSASNTNNNNNSSSNNNFIFEEIFQNENLSSPAFVEFDETNKKIITRNSLLTYKIWNMANYKLIFEINDRRIEEIRTAEAILATIKLDQETDILILNIYNIETGKIIINYQLDLLENLSLEFLEIFSNKLLIKQEGEKPILIDLTNLEYIYINNKELDAQSLFMYISSLNTFITLNKNNLFFYNLQGELIRTITNKYIDCISPQFIQISPNKLSIMIYWKQKKINFNRYDDGGFYTPKSNSQLNRRITSSSAKRIISKYDNSNNNTLNEINNSICRNLSPIRFINNNNNYYTGNRNLLSTPRSNKEFFDGEFELINLKEDIMDSFSINSENAEFKSKKYENDEDIININNKDLMEIMENIDRWFNNKEEIAFFNFDSRVKMIYIVTLSGKIILCDY
jgi:hypothetical protein